MLKIDFFIDDTLEDITGYELGGIIINSEIKKYRLEDTKYYFMVFLSLIDILNTISAFYKNDISSIKINFADSSFYIWISKLKHDIVELYVMNQYIGKFYSKDFYDSIYCACKELYLKYKNSLHKTNLMIDIEKAFNRYELIVKI